MSYFNAQKILFQNSLRESMCSRVLNTAEIAMAELLAQISIHPRIIGLENISVSQT